MRIFAVFLDQVDPDVAERIKKAYPDHYKMSENFFLVPSDTIAEEVAINVGIKGDDRIVGGVVFKLNNTYSGYTTRSLWDWLQQFEEQG